MLVWERDNSLVDINGAIILYASSTRDILRMRT